jgi:hypothetical protein
VALFFFQIRRRSISTVFYCTKVFTGIFRDIGNTTIVLYAKALDDAKLKLHLKIQQLAVCGDVWFVCPAPTVPQIQAERLIFSSVQSKPQKNPLSRF